MASSAEGSGKTLDAAIEAARAQLGVARNAIDVEVLQDPVPSRFGVVGSPARVKVTVRDGAAAPVVAPVPAQPGPAQSGPALGSPGASDQAPVTGVRAPGAVATAEAVATPAAAERASAPRPPRPRPDVDPEVAVQQAEAAGDFVEGLLELLDLEADITTWADRNGGHVEVEGPDLSPLVGRDGDTLSAMEELTRLAAIKQTGERVRVVLDINGFRQRRREVLAKLAQEVAERVIAAGAAEELQPMPPHERKVIHDAVADLSGVVTESVGEEPRRRVAIVPA